MVRKLVMVAIGLAVLVITPYFLFHGDFDRDSEFQYGAAEMRSAVEGLWVAELMPKEGPARTITFTIEQAGPPAHSSRGGGWIRPAAACEHRTLVKSAEACLDTSDMLLKLVAIEGAPSSALGGTFEVRGKKFETGRLELMLDGTTVDAQIAPTGAVLQAHVMARSLEETAHRVTLSRIRPGLPPAAAPRS
jgi:hypothetical protein